MAAMTLLYPRVDYDRIAHLYDEPGRDYDSDASLVEFLETGNRRQASRLRILDLGCGTGKQLTADRKMFPEIQMTGLDLFYGMLEQARRRCAGIQWIQGDSTHPPFASDSFDYITNQFSYHHLRDKAGMLSSIFRILRAGGRFVLTNLDPWTMPGWIVYRYFPASRQRDLVDFLPVDRLTALLEGIGFWNTRVQYKHIHSEESLSGFLAYASRRHRTSQLMAIPDRDYLDGLAKLKADLENHGGDFRIPTEICLVWVRGDKPG